MTRELRLSVLSQRDPLEPIPVETFTRALNALRSATCHAGEMLLGADERDRGRFVAEVAERCRLVITGLRAGSAQVTVALPPEDQARLIGPDEHGDGVAETGEQAMQLVLSVAGALVAEAAEEGVTRLLPDWATPRQIERFFSDFADMSPTDNEHTITRLGSALDGEPSYELTSEVRRRAQRLGAPQPAGGIETQERTIFGRLVELRVKTKFRVGIEHGTQEFICPYDEEFSDALRENLANVVALRGLFRVRPRDPEDDELLDLLEVLDVTPVDLEPLEVSSVAWGDRRVDFVSPVSVPVDVTHDMFVLSLEDLRIVAHGDTRPEAEAAFAEQVLWVWDTYGRRDDSELSPSGQEFKAVVRRMIREGAE